MGSKDSVMVAEVQGVRTKTSSTQGGGGGDLIQTRGGGGGVGMSPWCVVLVA